MTSADTGGRISAGADPTASEPAGTAPLGQDTIDALQVALSAEHAALWAYGLVAAYDGTAAATVATMVANHQGTRDVAANLIVAGGATPVGPNPAYTPPNPVSDPATALQLALTIETDCANAWRGVIGATDDSALRGTALSALTDSALRMVTWRKQGSLEPLTVPLPGMPQQTG